MKSILIVGGGQLAEYFQETRTSSYKINIVTRQEKDLTVQQNCNDIALRCTNYDFVIITAGKFVETFNLFEMLSTNFVGPCSIIAELINQNYQGHIIVISSHASKWTSWPGIDIKRLSYGCSKNAITTFVDSCSLAFNNPTFTVIEPPAFQTSMSNFRGWDLESICESIDYALQKKVEKITLMRYNSTTHNKRQNNE